MKKRKKKDPKFWFEDEFEIPTVAPFREVDRVMRDMWRRPFALRFRMPGIKMIRSFPVDIAESNKEIFIKADLPGFEKDEVKLKATSRTIRITAEKKKQVVEKGKTYYKQERSFGSAQRFLSLHSEVDPDKVKAKFQKGVLEITLPKVKAKEKTKEVKVQ